MALSGARSAPSSMIGQLSATLVDQHRFGCPSSFCATSSSSRMVSPLTILHIGRHSSLRTDGVHFHVRRRGSSSPEASTYQNTRESAKTPQDSSKTEASRPSLSVEISENDTTQKSGTDADGARPEAKKSDNSPESLGATTNTAQKSESEPEGSQKVSQAEEASTSEKPGDDGDTVKVLSEPAQKAGANASAKENVDGGKAKASPKASQKAGGNASAKETVDGGKAKASPKASEKAEAGVSAKKTDLDKSGPGDKSPTTERPTPTAKAAAKKAPAKSFEATMLEDVVPQLLSTLEEEDGLNNIDVSFEDNQLKVGFVKGEIPYCFWAFFPDGSLTGARGSSLTSHGIPASTVEPFLVDEKKITGELIVFWVKKRLFMQNLLSMN